MVLKEDVSWRINSLILKEFKLLSIKKDKKYSEYIEELIIKELEKEKENENISKE